MALAKDRAPPCSFYGSYMLEAASPSPIQFPSLSINPSSSFYPFEEDHYKRQISLQGDDDSDHHPSANNSIGNTYQVQVSHSPPLSSSSTSATSSNGIAFHGGGSDYHQPEEAPRSHINFDKATNTTDGGGFMHTNGSFLSFQPQNCYSFGQPNDQYPLWEASSPHQDHYSHQNRLKMKSAVGGGDFRVFKEANSLQTARPGYHDAGNEWLYTEGAAVAGHSAQESATVLQQTSFNKKRPLMEEESMQTLKKQCNSTKKQPNKPKPSNSTKDHPQSIAAKNRRERISERLKILQDLVPNGSKVDMVTMLEKAISYVKFLQLQVKVLATDEFWPAGGGKLPDITQVRDAIDAILSTQRDKPSSTSENKN